MDQQTTTCRWLLGVWLIATLIWLAFIAWRTIEGWPSIPLDIGSADAQTTTAYNAAQIQYATMAAALSVAAPLIAWLLLKALCRARRI